MLFLVCGGWVGDVCAVLVQGTNISLKVECNESPLGLVVGQYLFSLRGAAQTRLLRGDMSTCSHSHSRSWQEYGSRVTSESSGRCSDSSSSIPGPYCSAVCSNHQRRVMAQRSALLMAHQMAQRTANGAAMCGTLINTKRTSSAGTTRCATCILADVSILKVAT